MSEIIISSESEVGKGISEQKIKEAKWIVVIREIIGAIIWLSMLVKFLIFDFDILIIKSIHPSWLVILNYKIFVILGLISLFWILLGNTNFVKLICTVLFYPFIFILWRVPKIFWKSKSWAGVFVSIGVLFAFLSSIKSNFINFTLFSISVLLIFKSNSQLLLILSMIYFFIYLIFHYILKFRYAFKPSYIFSLQADVVNKYWIQIEKYFTLAEDVKEKKYDNMNSSQKEKWSNNLQFILVLNRLFYFTTSKLRKFQKSRLNIAYYFLNIFFTFVVTVIVFSLQNQALYKLDPHAFSSAPKGNYIFFIYYSFNTLLTNSINDFYPISDSARFINSFETLFSFLLLVILFFLFTTIIRDKHNDEISSVIETMSKKGGELEKLIDKEYKMDLFQAIDMVNKIQGNMINIIYYFTNNNEVEND